MRIVDKQWFLSHCEWIFQNRCRLQNRPCADFIISGFVINAFACPYCNYKIDKITLGNLINLWDNGFTYNDLPLIHYHQSYGNSSINIAYIENGKLVNQTFAYNDTEKYTPTDEVKLILKDLRKQKL